MIGRMLWGYSAVNISEYKKQHTEILQIVKKIETLCANGVARFSKELSGELMMLRFKVKVHLSAEDKFLYPALDLHQEGSAAAFAARYRPEMVGISSFFLMYAARWERAEAIEAKPDQFLEETQKIIEALRHRIQLENTEFYPAVEKTGGSAPPVSFLKF